MNLKANYNLNSSDVIIDIPEEHNVLKISAQYPKDSYPKKSFNDMPDIENKQRIYEQQIIEEGIKMQQALKLEGDGQTSAGNKKKTVLNRLSTQQYQVVKAQEVTKQRERELSLQRADSIMKQFKNRVDKTTKDLEVNRQNISYQRFDQSFDNKERKVLFLKIKVLEMQLNLQRAEDYIEKQLPLNSASREQLMESLLEYLLSEEQKEKNMRKSLKSPKKKTVLKNNQLLFVGLANVNMAISQELVDCTPKTGMIKQNQIINCQICYQDILGSQALKLSASCHHQFCIGCIEKYITFRVQDGRCTHIYCPQQNCKSVYTDKEISKVISKNIFQQYLKIKKLSIINNDPQIRYCQKGVCDSYLKFSPGTQIDTCSFCNFKVCFECYMPAHKGMTCEQAMEKKLQTLIHAIRKGDCPSCKNKIMKIQVENAVRCPTCNYDFCWLCNKKYSRYHYRFWNVCSGCPNMLEAIEQPTFMNKFKYFRKGLFRFFIIILMSLFLLCGYFVSLIILPIFVPGGVFLYYYYKKFEQRSLFEQFLIGVLLLALGIIGFFVWLILCLVPGIFMAMRKFFQISEAYLESIGFT